MARVVDEFIAIVTYISIMLIHEYQGKALLATTSITIPPGGVASDADEAQKIAKKLGGDAWMVKAQIHAGGRGLAGGIGTAHSVAEVKEQATRLLKTRLRTKQTDADGLMVNHVYVEKKLPIAQSMYLCMMMNPASACLTLLAAHDGGVHIEDGDAPLLSVDCPPATAIQPFHARLIAECYKVPHLASSLLPLLQSLYDVCLQEDILQLEINPLALTHNDEWAVLDCKVALDDNAAFRHDNWASLVDDSQSAAIDVMARQLQLRYIGLDGSIGCMVNGAGLAMATMDALVQQGLVPANFLDIGGDADVNRVQAALQLMVESAKVSHIFINIFGGIVHCDMIARALITASERLNITIPIVVRLAGAKAHEARALLQQSSLTMHAATTLQEALTAIKEA